MDLTPRQLAEQLRRPSGPHADAIANGMNRSNAALNRAALALLAVRAGESVLEIGPGNAAFADDLLAIAGTRYTGVDSSEAMVDAARRRHADAVRQQRARFHCGDSAQLPQPDAAFDAALCVNTLYFWATPPRDLAELARVLRPGGRLCLAFGDAAFMAGLAFAAHGFQLHEVAALEQMLDAAGLPVIERRLHREHTAGNDGRVHDKRFHLLLARRR
jgi:ubiquinone/menaquinone biosynthesis C-methylase UbiE